MAALSVDFRKHKWTNTSNDMAVQIITDCGNFTLDFKQRGFCASLLFLQTLGPRFPNEMQKCTFTWKEDFYFTCNESKIHDIFTFWNKLQEKCTFSPYSILSIYRSIDRSIFVLSIILFSFYLSFYFHSIYHSNFRSIFHSIVLSIVLSRSFYCSIYSENNYKMIIIHLEKEWIDIAGATDDVVLFWLGGEVCRCWACGWMPVNVFACHQLAINNRWCSAERVEAVYLLQKAILSLIIL